MVKIERRIGPIGLMGLIGRIKDGVGGTCLSTYFTALKLPKLMNVKVVEIDQFRSRGR